MRHELRPVLMDFGLVTRARGTIGREALDVSGRMRGTLPYMAPETLQGQMPDARADVYALGCMLFESLTGRPPFLAESPEQLWGMLQAGEIPPASTRATRVPKSLDALLAKTLARDRVDRIGHAVDVGAWLADILKEGGAAKPTSRPAATTSRTHLFDRRWSAGRPTSNFSRCAFLPAVSQVPSC